VVLGATGEPLVKCKTNGLRSALHAAVNVLINVCRMAPGELQVAPWAPGDPYSCPPYDATVPFRAP